MTALQMNFHHSIFLSLIVLYELCQEEAVTHEVCPLRILL
jgi:hypothetical protein